MVTSPNSKMLTSDERKKRAMATINVNSIIDHNYKCTRKVAANKAYPEGDHTAEAFALIIKKGMVSHLSGESDLILNFPDKVASEFSMYVDYMTSNKMTLTKGAFVAWLGQSKTTYNQVKNGSGLVSSVLQKIDDYIGDFRVKMADEGRIPTIQHIFEMANSHGYTRSDPKQAINIEINTQHYAAAEIQSVVSDVIDVEFD
jgi:hypothetical protein